MISFFYKRIFFLKVAKFGYLLTKFLVQNDFPFGARGNGSNVSSIPRAMGRHNKLNLNHRRQPRSRSRMYYDAQRGDKRDAVENLCCISTIFTHTEFGCACVCMCDRVRVYVCAQAQTYSREREKERGRVSE